MPDNHVSQLAEGVEPGSHMFEVLRLNDEVARLGGTSILGGIAAAILTPIFGPGVDPVAVGIACIPVTAIAYSISADVTSGEDDSWGVLAGALLWFVVATVIAAIVAFGLGKPLGSVPEAAAVNGGVPVWIAAAIGIAVGVRSGLTRRRLAAARQAERPAEARPGEHSGASAAPSAQMATPPAIETGRSEPPTPAG